MILNCEQSETQVDSILYAELYCHQVTLLVMNDGAMVVNLHPTIVSMLEEAKWMRRLGLKIPENFHTLNMANVKKTHAQLKVTCRMSFLAESLC